MTIAAPVVIAPALPERPRARKIHALTTLRFFAAAMIVVYHASESFGFSLGAFDRIVWDQAVSMFFVLSGFILTYVYPELPTWQARGRFLLARFGRIWPAYLAALAMVYLLLWDPTRLGTPRDSLLLGGVYLAMLQAWIPLAWVYFSYNSVAWTISTEFGFYYMFPWLIHNFRRTWHLKLALALGLVAGMIALANGLHLLPLHDASTDTGVTTTGLVYINPLARLFEFVLGMCTAQLWRSLQGKHRVGRFVGTLLEIAAIACVAVSLWESPVIAYHAGQIPWLGIAGSEWLAHGGVACASFAFLILILASELGLLSRLLAAPLGIVLGEISFTVYLIQQVLLRFYVWHRPRLAHGPLWLQISIFIAVLLIAAHLIWVCFERPMRNWIVGLARKGPRRGSPTTEPPRGLFAWALNPSGSALTMEITLLLAILLPIGILGATLPKNPDYLPGSPTTRPAPQPTGAAALRDIHFGNELLLKSITLQRIGESLQIKVNWECVQAFDEPCRVAVHLLDDAGKNVQQDDFSLDRPHARSGDQWTVTHTVEPDKMKGVSRLALGVYPVNKGLLFIQSGPRDWENHRLLVPLPPKPAAARPAASTAPAPAK